MKQQTIHLILASFLLFQTGPVIAGANGRLHDNRTHCDLSINTYSDAICNRFLIESPVGREIEYGELDVPVESVTMTRGIAHNYQVSTQLLNFEINFKQPFSEDPNHFYEEGPFCTTKNGQAFFYQDASSQQQYSHYYLIFYPQNQASLNRRERTASQQLGESYFSHNLVSYVRPFQCTVDNINFIPITIECHYHRPQPEESPESQKHFRHPITNQGAQAFDIPEWKPGDPHQESWL